MSFLSEQHGFQSGSSTTSLLSDSVYDWMTEVNKGKSVDVILFDLSRAFDMVNHKKLLFKLENYGVRGQLLSWLKSYLQERHMTVKVHNSYSKRYTLQTGVPQGSALSPLLFLAYTADLPSYLKTHPDMKVQMFADDIKIYFSYQPNDQTFAHNTISLAIQRMISWSRQWDLPLNLSKTVALHFGEAPQIPYFCNSTTIQYQEQVRDPGVIIDKSFDFSTHFDVVTKKALSSIFVIMRSVHVKDPDLLIFLYKTYVLPHLEYATPVSSPFLKKDIKKLEKVQQIFARLVYYSFPDPGYSDTLPSYEIRLNALKLKSLKYRRVVNDLFLSFRILRMEVKLKASKTTLDRLKKYREETFGDEQVMFSPDHPLLTGYFDTAFKSVRPEILLNSLRADGIPNASWMYSTIQSGDGARQVIFGSTNAKLQEAVVDFVSKQSAACMTLQDFALVNVSKQISAKPLTGVTDNQIEDRIMQEFTFLGVMLKRTAAAREIISKDALRLPRRSTP
ncbi:hypothetical protein RB195_009995 [Necator americanus]|uniref:Reverse transcriptase domain-containing protein n=1 Tax=Necator americanus TaxID=51031 RepID=A0ABR1CVV0_NECAM